MSIVDIGMPKDLIGELISEPLRSRADAHDDGAARFVSAVEQIEEVLLAVYLLGGCDFFEFVIRDLGLIAVIFYFESSFESRVVQLLFHFG